MDTWIKKNRQTSLITVKGKSKKVRLRIFLEAGNVCFSTDMYG